MFGSFFNCLKICMTVLSIHCLVIYILYEGGGKMIKLSELKMKEVILIKNGKRLGFIDDLIIDAESGYIISFVILERDMKSVFLKRTFERIIDWKHIVTIGKDTILVSENIKSHAEENEENPTEKKV